MNYLRCYPAIWIWGKDNNKFTKEADVQAHASDSSVVKADLGVLKLVGYVDYKVRHVLKRKYLKYENQVTSCLLFPGRV